MKWLPIVALTVILGGCATCPPPQIETRVIDTACTWVKPLTFSKQDTPETKRQILAQELTRRQNCPPK